MVNPNEQNHPAPDPANNRNRKEAPQPSTKTEIAICWFTAALVACSVVAGVFQCNGVRQATRAADAAKQAADAARDSVTLAGDTAEKQLRAYVHIHTTSLTYSPVRSQITGLTIFKNTGQTPARQLAYKTCIVCERPDYDGPFNMATNPTTSLTLASTEESQIPSTLDLTPEQKADLVSGARKLWYCGEASYTDVFGKTHTTPWRYVQGPQWSIAPVLPTSVRLFIAPTGNDAD